MPAMLMSRHLGPQVKNQPDTFSSFVLQGVTTVAPGIWPNFRWWKTSLPNCGGWWIT
jgi:hypothetical protein